MTDDQKQIIAAAMDKPLAELTLREAVTAATALEDATDEELAELGLPSLG